MQPERTNQDLGNGPLHADPEPEPDTQDPTTKGAAYHKNLEEEPGETGATGDTEPGEP